MTDNILTFPGASAPEQEEKVTPEEIMESAQNRYDELILIGRTKGSRKYECVSTLEIPETLYHITRIHHRLNLFLDGGGK